jgi:polysaccharide biosynthesis/export protein
LAAFVLAAMSAAGIFFLAGCGGKDNSISLEQFISQQQQIAARSVPATPVSEAEQLNRELGPVRIGPDDVISVAISSGDAKTILPLTEIRITSAGTATLPLIGPVQLASMTLEDAEKAIRNAYVPQYMVEALVLIKMVDPRMTKVVVLGAVGAPGLVSLPRGGRDVFHAIVAAGGGGTTTSTATAIGPGPASPGSMSMSAVANASGRVMLRRIRQGGRTQSFDLREPEGLRQVLTLDPLDDGDIITVEGGRPNSFFVGGLVMAPSRQDYPPGTRLTVLQAIAGAGGLNQYVFPRKGTLIRRMDGHDVHVRLDVERITDGEDPDVEMLAGDILWVPHTFRTRALEFFNRIFYLRAGAAADFQVFGSKLYGDASSTSTTTIITAPAGP